MLTNVLNIAPGDLVYENAGPFVYALCTEQRLSHCDHCFKPIQKSYVRCPDCNYVQFCCIECLNGSDKIHGGYECALFRRQRGPVRLMTRLMLRILAKSDQAIKPDYIFGHERSWECLMDHYENIIHDMDAMHKFNLIIEELELVLPQLDIQTLLIIYGKLLINSFAITEPNTGRIIGRALYLGASIFDHSCRPDLYFQFDGLRIYFIAARHIQLQTTKDSLSDPKCDTIQQLYISYLDELLPVNERQDHLSSSYYFHCECPRCQFDMNESKRDTNEWAEPKANIYDLIDDYFHSELVYSIIQFAMEQFWKLSKNQFNHFDNKSNNAQLKQLRDKLLNQPKLLPLEQKLVEDVGGAMNFKLKDFFLCHQRFDHREMLPLAKQYSEYYNFGLTEHKMTEEAELIAGNGLHSRHHYHPRLLPRFYHWLGILLLLSCIQSSSSSASSGSSNREQQQSMQSFTSIMVVVRTICRHIQTIHQFLKHPYYSD